MGVRAIKAFLVTAAMLLMVPVGAAGPVAAAPFCGITWGSVTKTRTGMTTAPIVAARAGGHACYDRFVVELAGPVAGFNVRYASRVTGVADDDPIPLRSGAFLQVVVRAPAYNGAGQATYAPARRSEAVRVTGFRTFRQIAYAGSFEGVTAFGIGVRAQLPFRVIVLPGQGGHSRLVLDVGHRWS